MARGGELAKEVSSELPPISDLGVPGVRWDESIHPRFAINVAEEILATAQAFSDQLDADELESAIELSRAIAATYDQGATLISKDRAGAHSQVSYAKQAPIFVAMDPDPTRNDDVAAQLERVARLMLLLHVLGRIQLTKDVIVEASEFCRLFRHRPSVLLTETGAYPQHEIENALSSFIRNRDWEGLIKGISQIRLTVRTEYPNKIDDADIGLTGFERDLDRFSNLMKYFRSKEMNEEIVKQRRRKRKLVQAISAPLNSGSPHSGLIPPLAGTDIDPPVNLCVLDENETRVPRVKNKVVKSLALFSSAMRINSLWSGHSIQALLPDQGKACMYYIIYVYQPDSLAGKIAQILWVLSGASTLRFDNLLVGCGAQLPLTSRPKPDASVSVRGNTITIEFNPPAEVNFEAIKPEVAHLYSGTNQKVSLQIELPEPLDPACLSQLQGIRSLDDTLRKAVTTAKGEIEDKVREFCDYFHENSFRAGLYQSAFGLCHDIPLCQLLTGDQNGLSNAALHYTAYPMSAVQSILNQALAAQYPGIFYSSNSNNLEQESTWIGAPTSTFSFSAYQLVTKSLYDERCIGDPDGPEIDQLIRDHNARVEYLGWLLLVVTGNRNQKDFPKLRLAQISFALKCLLFYDKGSDPTLFRRICFLPDYVINELLTYIAHLRRLSSRLAKFRSATDLLAIGEYLREASKGDRPLLVLIQHHGEQVPRAKLAHRLSHTKFGYRCRKWDGRAFIKSRFGDGVQGDLPRHMMATQMRYRTQCSASLIEIQIGHGIGYDVFGDNSIVSLTELARDLDPHLTDYLKLCGFDTIEEHSVSTKHSWDVVPVENWHQLAAKISKNLREDTERTKNMYGSGLAIDATTSREVIEKGICLACGADNWSALPIKFHLDKAQCKRIYRDVLVNLPTNHVTGLLSATHLLERKIKSLKFSHQWVVEFPPRLFWDFGQPIPLTEFHLHSHELLQRLRKAVAKQRPAEIPPDSVFDYHAFLLLVFGGTSTWNEAFEVLRCAKDHSQTSPDGEALLVEMQEPVRESRTLTGIGMAVVLAFVHAGVRSRSRENVKPVALKKYLPSNWVAPEIKNPQQAFEVFIANARRVELPPILARVESQELVAKGMPVERLAAYLAGTGGNKIVDLNEIAQLPPDREITRRTRGQISLREETVLITRLVDNPDAAEMGLKLAGATQHERSQTAINEMLEHRQFSQVGELLGFWAIELLGPFANRARHARQPTLSVGTVKDYVQTASRALSSSLIGVDLYDFADDELFQIIYSNLSTELSTRDDQAMRLTRLFSELSPTKGIPELIFPTSRSHEDIRRAIDADIITEKENTLAMTCLHAWHTSPHIATLMQKAIAETNNYLWLVSKTGLRRSEANHLYLQDLSTHDKQDIHYRIRPSNKFTLKTKAARRTGGIDYKSAPDTLRNAAIGEAKGRLFPTMFAGGLQYSPNQAVNMALKYASGDENSRQHRLRKRVAADELYQIEKTESVVEKIVAVNRATTALGHANFSSTVSRYAGNVYDVIGRKYGTPLLMHGTPFIDFLTGNKLRYIKQQSFHAHDKTPAGLSRIAIKKYMKRHEKLTYDKPIAPLPNVLFTNNASPSAIATLLQKILTEHDTNAFRCGRVSTETAIKLFEKFSEAQDVFGIQLVKPEHLNGILAGLEYSEESKTPASSSRSSRTKKSIFEQWIHSLAGLDPDIFIESITGLDRYFIGLNLDRRAPTWRFEQETGFLDCEALSTTLRLPLRFIRRPGRLEFEIQLEGKMTPRFEKRTIQALAISVFTLSRFFAMGKESTQDVL